MKFIYGTTNQAKIEQVKEYFEYFKIPLEIISLKDIGFEEEILENGATFEENSYIKAKAVLEFCKKKQIKEMIVTDDAGLCVDALHGEPGIYSARYAGKNATQKEVLDKLLKNMEQIEEKSRTAKFVCVLTAILPNEELIVCKGETNGKIAKKVGTMGKLTYGPVFIPDGMNKVMNDLTEEELGTTHREKAFRELIKQLQLKNIEELK